MASHLPGFPIQAGVAVGMGAAIVAVLRLPLSAVVIATVLTSHASSNVEPLIIVGVVVSYVVTLLLARSPATPGTPDPRRPARQPRRPPGSPCVYVSAGAAARSVASKSVREIGPMHGSVTPASR